MWFEEISFRGFPGKLKSVGRTAATAAEMNQKQLEQLERLRSEITPAAPWLPILVIHIRSQVKSRQSQSYKFEKIAKNSTFIIFW